MIPYIVLLVFVIVVLIIYKFKSISADYDIVLKKIHDGENGIDELLKRKGEVMKSIVENINSINDNSVFPDIDKIIKVKEDMLMFNLKMKFFNCSFPQKREKVISKKQIFRKKIKKKIFFYHQLKEYLLVNKSYIPDEVIGEKIKELEDIELDLEATKRFYNDNSNIFNDLVDRFPSRIVARKRGYDFKYLYTFDKEEFFEILKNSQKKKNSEV